MKWGRRLVALTLKSGTSGKSVHFGSHYFNENHPTKCSVLILIFMLNMPLLGVSNSRPWLVIVLDYGCMKRIAYCGVSRWRSICSKLLTECLKSFSGFLGFSVFGPIERAHYNFWLSLMTSCCTHKQHENNLNDLLINY